MNEEYDLDEMAPWLVIIIALAGGFLRVLLLGTKGMWLDETFSVWLANQNVADMLQWIVKIDQHPPLYYLLLHFWVGFFGDSPYFARLLSALFGTATIPVIYLIGKRISGTVVGLSAAVFLALSLFNIYFAQETRMYTLLTFNASVAIYALVRLLTDPRSTKLIGSQFIEYLKNWQTQKPVEPEPDKEFSYKEQRHQTGWKAWGTRHRWNSIQTIDTDLAWVIFVVFSAATLLTHNTAVLFILAINFYVLGLILFQRMNKSGSQTTFQAPSFSNWIMAQIGIFVLWSPWLTTFIQQASRVDQEFWLPKPDWETVTWSLRALLNASAPTQASQIMTWVLCAVLFLGAVYYRKSSSILLFLVTLFVTPVLGELLVSIRRPIFFDRTLIWITIPMFLLLAAGIAQLRFRFLMILALGILGANYIFSDSDYYRFVDKEDWNTAAGYIANFAEKDDLVLFNSNFVIIPFNYYFKTYEDLYFIDVEKQGIPLDLFNDGILEPKMTADDVPGLISMIRGHDRVWLVYSHNDYTDPLGLIPQTIASQMKLTQSRDFWGGQVQLYESP